jgi:hypothetical protein
LGQQQDTLHKEWVQLDIDLFKTLTKIDKTKPKDVEQFFNQSKRNPNKDTLGFDWVMYHTGKGGGYVSVSVDIYYYKGHIMSYKLTSRLPTRPDLISDYKKLYSTLLPEYIDGTYYYEYKPDNVLKPLKNYNGKNNVTVQMANYMSPTSDLIYGVAGGLPVTELYNRKFFNGLKNNLTNDQIVTLMYAINPASRLTAIEYYYKHKKEFSNQDKIDLWIEQVYKNKPIIQSISGCIIYNEDSRKLVEFYSKLK